MKGCTSAAQGRDQGGGLELNTNTVRRKRKHKNQQKPNKS